MNQKIKMHFFEIERPDFYLFIFILDRIIPPPKISKFSENTEYIEIYNKIHHYVVTEKHFLDKDITVDIIVRQCNVKKKSLNKILRLKDDVAFHAYINKQRVIYASALLLEPSNKLIEVVASESCFNNSRTFVRNFKIVYHMTPSEYRRSHRTKNT